MTWVARCAPLLLALLLAATARADGAQRAAREAYDRGVEAHNRGDLGRAAEEFAQADALAPSPVALGAAIDAAVAANRPVLGVELVARAARTSPQPPELKRSVDAARVAFAGKTGRVTVVCNDGAPCGATLDGRELAPSVERVVLVGEHAVVFRVGGSEEPRRVQVGPDAALELHPSAAAVLPVPPPGLVAPAPVAPAPAASPSAAAPAPAQPATPALRDASASEPQAGKPLPRLVVVIAGGLTAVVGGVALWSGLAADGVHDDFEAARCPDFAGAGCAELAARGSRLETRANVLFATTGALGAATLVAALLWVDWGAGDRKAASVRLSPHVGPSGGALGLSGTF